MYAWLDFTSATMSRMSGCSARLFWISLKRSGISRSNSEKLVLVIPSGALVQIRFRPGIVFLLPAVKHFIVEVDSANLVNHSGARRAKVNPVFNGTALLGGKGRIEPRPAWRCGGNVSGNAGIDVLRAVLGRGCDCKGAAVGISADEGRALGEGFGYLRGKSIPPWSFSVVARHVASSSGLKAGIAVAEARRPEDYPAGVAVPQA